MKRLYAEMSDLPLKEMDGVMLSALIREEAGRAGMDVQRVAYSIALAAYLHRNQTRKSRGLMPVTHYIEHPLRGALRYLRYGGVDQDILVAIVLHDTVEDCLDDILRLSTERVTAPEEFKSDIASAREIAYGYLASRFGYEVSVLARRLTNPIPPPGVKQTREEKNARYAAHVREAIEDPRVAVAKFIDFVDNASSLPHHSQSDPEMVRNLARKYLSLVDIFEERVKRQDVSELLTSDGYEALLAHVRRGKSLLYALSVLS